MIEPNDLNQTYAYEIAHYLGFIDFLELIFDDDIQRVDLPRLYANHLKLVIGYNEWA